MALNRLPFRTQIFSVSRSSRVGLGAPLRNVSTESATSTLVETSKPELELSDTDFTALSTPGSEIIESYDPIAQSAARKKQLPASRYRFRAPRYNRGPLHPHQSPHASNPTARNFIPGPFSSPRLAQTYDNILAHDLMVLYYQHRPFNTPPPPEKQRLRGWDGSSPYHKNRPLRAPRGSGRLGLLDQPINFRSVPKLEAITVSVLVKEASENSQYTHTAGMIVQAITSQRATVFKARKTLGKGQRIDFSQKAGKPIAVGTTMTGEQMWHFMSTFVAFVLPKIKDWKGVKSKGGDRNGNFTIGIHKDTVELWPEIAVNYDSYLSKMIPGIDITLTTSATNDQDGKMLLAALGIPFDASGQ